MPRLASLVLGRAAAAPESSPPVGEPGRWHKLGAALLIATLCGLQVRAILGPYEDWPFTSAPMFARYHADGQPLYELVFLVERADGSEIVLNPKRDLGLGELGFRRQFFARYYGSTDPRHPGGHQLDDTPARFQQRLLVWMRKTSAAYAKQHGHIPNGLALEVRRLHAGKGERRRIAYFEPQRQILTLAPLVSRAGTSEGS